MKVIANKIRLFISSLLVMLFLMTSSGYSQSVWVEEPDGNSEIGIDFRIPSFDGFDVEGITFANYLYSNVVISNNIMLQLDLPISHYSNGGGESNFGIGNPYVGFQFRSADASTRFDVGVRLPLQNDLEQAHTTGFVTENYSIGAYFPEATTLVLNIHYRYNNSSGLGFRLGGGPELIAVNEGDTEVFLKSYAQLLYKIDNTTFGGGVNSRWYATADGGTFSDLTNYNLGISGSREWDTFTTGAYIEVPLSDNISSSLNYIVGLNLSINF